MNAVRIRLMQLGMTQTQLAELLGVSSQYVNMLLQGKRRWTMVLSRKVVAALGASSHDELFYLLPGEGIVARDVKVSTCH